MSAAYDRIICRELEYFVHLGISEDERKEAQRILIDLELALDLRKASQADDLSQTICWAGLNTLLENFLKSRSWNLLEAVSEDSAALILESYPQLHSITLRAKKFCLPNAKWVGIEINRTR